MTDPARYEARLTNVEADASAALRLARAHEQDIAELPLRVDAIRRALNAHSVQTAERFSRIDQRFDRLELKVDTGFARIQSQFAHVDAGFAQIQAQFDQVAASFADIRGRLDGTAAGLAQIVDLLQPREPGDDAS